MIPLFRSIRWRLQIWYGIMLVLVLIGFGVTAYQFERGRRLREVDEELNRGLNLMITALRPGPPRDRRPPGPRGGRPGDGAGRPPGPFPDRGEFRVPQALQRLASLRETNALYYVAWDAEGAELVRAATAPEEIPRPKIRVSRRPPSPAMRMRGEFREAFASLRTGDSVVVGRSMSGELSDLRRLGWGLGGIGAGVLLFGLAGGWWIATRAIRPIEKISATAGKIAAGDLSQRIDVAETESELGRLAAVLNSTFDRLDAAFAQQARFTSDAAHELRTPVTVILTQTQTALSRERASEEYRQALEACKRSAQRMRRLIESLLQLARFDAGRDAIEMRCFALDAVARECVESVRPMAEAREIRIHAEVEPVQCHGDPERMAQAIINLLANAVEYNRDKGEVRLQVGRAGDEASVTVADTGNGVAPEDLPHVFERFYRADRSRSGAGHAGLGLAIVKAVVEAHGGTIDVTSEKERGATFVVRLPGAVGTS